MKPWSISLCFTVFTLTLVHSQDTSQEVYNLEHLQDMICYNNDTSLVQRHGVLVMYETSCVHKLPQLSISKTVVPSEQYLVYMEHDIARVPQCHWYDLPKEHQLITHFPVIGCPTVYFLRKGFMLNMKPEVWMASSSSQTFSQWVWSMMTVQVKVRNSLDAPILVQAGPGRGAPHQVDSKVVMAGKSIIMTTYQSHLLMTFSLSETKASEFLCGWMVKEELKEVTVEGYCGKSHQDWFKEVNMKELTEQRQMINWLVAHKYRHTLNLKQALVVPKHTQTGYYKRKIPSDAYQVLLEFYEKNKEKRQKEQWHMTDSILNQDEVRCYMVQLDVGLKEMLKDAVRPILEEWSGLELEMTAIYGIREYFQGSVLKNHVDRLETHVISAILQVDKDLGGKSDWPLEVIDYEGHRQQVYMESGDMVLYESARLIHGRPSPLQGNRYANVFIHFRPTHGWNYKIDPQGKYISQGDKIEQLYPVDTELTKNWKFRRDEL